MLLQYLKPVQFKKLDTLLIILYFVDLMTHNMDSYIYL